MTQQNEHDPKPLPMKTIAWATFAIFCALAMGFLILPAFFDKNPLGMKLFDEGPAPWAISEEEQKQFQFTESQLKGRYQFQQYCASCHGPEGRGNGPGSVTLAKRPPNFLDPRSTYKNELSKEGVIKTINEGIPGSQMPAFASVPDEIKNMIADYVNYIHEHRSQF